MKINSINTNTSFKATAKFNPDAQTIREKIGSESFLELDKAINTRKFKRLGSENTKLIINEGINNGDGVNDGIKLYLTEKVGDKFINTDNALIDNSNPKNKITAKKILEITKQLLKPLKQDVQAYKTAEKYDNKLTRPGVTSITERV